MHALIHLQSDIFALVEISGSESFTQVARTWERTWSELE